VVLLRTVGYLSWPCVGVASPLSQSHCACGTEAVPFLAACCRLASQAFAGWWVRRRWTYCSAGWLLKPDVHRRHSVRTLRPSSHEHASSCDSTAQQPQQCLPITCSREKVCRCWTRWAAHSEATPPTISAREGDRIRVADRGSEGILLNLKRPSNAVPHGYVWHHSDQEGGAWRQGSRAVRTHTHTHTHT
jgi:hypothetical protein